MTVAVTGLGRIMAGHDETGSDKLWRTLGAIEANFATVLRTQSEDRQASAAWRTGVREEFKAVRDDIGEVKADVSAVKTDVSNVSARVGEMEPNVDAFQKYREQARGAAMLARGLWVAVAASVGAIATMAVQMLTGRTPTPPHP